MLRLPIHPHQYRRGRTYDDENNDYYDDLFQEEGLDIVNLALQGFMDSSTIQAFFNKHGYSAAQTFGDPASAVVPVKAIGMNLQKLNRTLTRRKHDDKLAAAEAEGRVFPDEDTVALLGQGLDENEAFTALVMRDGDAEAAYVWHISQTPFGQLPDPHDALSPTTPEWNMA